MEIWLPLLHGTAAAIFAFVGIVFFVGLARAAAALILSTLLRVFCFYLLSFVLCVFHSLFVLRVSLPCLVLSCLLLLVLCYLYNII